MRSIDKRTNKGIDRVPNRDRQTGGRTDRYVNIQRKRSSNVTIHIITILITITSMLK